MPVSPTIHADIKAAAATAIGGLPLDGIESRVYSRIVCDDVQQMYPAVVVTIEEEAVRQLGGDTLNREYGYPVRVWLVARSPKNIVDQTTEANLLRYRKVITDIFRQQNTSIGEVLSVYAIDVETRPTFQFQQPNPAGQGFEFIVCPALLTFYTFEPR